MRNDLFVIALLLIVLGVHPLLPAIMMALAAISIATEWWHDVKHPCPCRHCRHRRER